MKPDVLQLLRHCGVLADEQLEGLERLPNLSTTELAALQEELRELALDRLAVVDASPEEPQGEEALAAAGALADAMAGVTAERRSRPEPRELVAALRARLLPDENESASARRGSAPLSALAARLPTARRPRVSAAGIRVLTAAGLPVVDARGLASEFVDRLSLLRGRRAGGVDRVARATIEFPAERMLFDDAIANAEIVRRAVGPEALTASGGVCGPLAARYDLPGLGDDRRPVRDALGRFGTDRGGVRLLPAPTLDDVAGGVGVWTSANDLDPGSDGPATKPLATVTCPTEADVTLAAIAARLRFGNFTARTNPELVAEWLRLLRVQHARIAEQALLDAIGAGSTSISDGQNLGAARDLLEAWGRIAAAYRSRHRMPRNAALTLLAPEWIPAMVRADLTREAPGDDRLTVSDEEIERMIRALGLRPVFYADTEAGDGQIFGTQGAGGANPWIVDVVSYVFDPGAWIHVDGGTLDLGVEIRDSSLNATNDVEAFFESFEAVAATGPESLKITNEVCVSGQAAALEEITCPTLGS